MPNLQSEGGSQGTRGRWEKRPMASSPALTASWLRSCPAGLPSSAPHKIKNSPSAAFPSALSLGVWSPAIGGRPPGNSPQVEDLLPPEELRTGSLVSWNTGLDFGVQDVPIPQTTQASNTPSEDLNNPFI